MSAKDFNFLSLKFYCLIELTIWQMAPCFYAMEMKALRKALEVGEKASFRPFSTIFLYPKRTHFCRCFQYFQIFKGKNLNESF